MPGSPESSLFHPEPQPLEVESSELAETEADLDKTGNTWRLFFGIGFHRTWAAIFPPGWTPFEREETAGDGGGVGWRGAEAKPSEPSLLYGCSCPGSRKAGSGGDDPFTGIGGGGEGGRRGSDLAFEQLSGSFSAASGGQKCN